MLKSDDVVIIISLEAITIPNEQCHYCQKGDYLMGSIHNVRVFVFYFMLISK